MKEILHQMAIDKTETSECLNEDKTTVLLTLMENYKREGEKACSAFFLSSLNDNKVFSLLIGKDENKEEYDAG